MHVGDLAMAEPIEVTEGKLGGAVMIEDNVGDPEEGSVTGDSDGGRMNHSLQLGIDCEDAVDAARLEKTGILGDEVFSVTVMRGKEEVALLHKNVSRSAKDLGVLAFAEFGKEDADGLGPEALERACNEAGLVAELLCSGLYSFAGGRWNGAAGRIVQDEGDGCRTEVQVFGEHLEADTARG